MQLGMTRLGKLQLIGPFALFAAVLGAEGAAWALAQSPASETLWFINLRLFGIFQTNHYLLSNYFDTHYLQLFMVLPVLLTACLGMIFRWRPLLPAASNLSFLYVAFMAYAWYIVESPPQAASLAEQSYHPAMMMMPSGTNLYMFLALFGVTLPSFVASHIAYFRAVRAEH
jgi:hypothetical protein